MSIRWPSALAALVIITALGFFREHVFLSINFQIFELNGGYVPEGAFRWPTFFPSLCIFDLWMLKWPLTAFFCLLFATATALSMRLATRQNGLTSTLWLYGAMITLATLFYVAHSFLGLAEQGYLIARHLLGLAQSPFPLLLLLAASWLRQR